MAKGFLLEADVENLALDSLELAGYKVYRSASPTTPNSEIDAKRDNNHTVAILTTEVDRALRRLNPGYTDDIYREAMRQLIRLADNPDMMINNHYFHKLLIEGIRVKTTVNGENMKYYIRLTLMMWNKMTLLLPTSSHSKEVVSGDLIRPSLLMACR